MQVVEAAVNKQVDLRILNQLPPIGSGSGKAKAARLGFYLLPVSAARGSSADITAELWI
jgi:hypothetical protein